METRIFRLFLFLVSVKLTFQAALPKTSNPRENQFMAVTVCRGGRRTIACPQLELLHIFTAFYGKMSGQGCDEPMVSPKSQIPTCSSKNAAQVIRGECHGQQSCDLYAEDSLYDDPCPEVLKYLFVSYTCQGKTDILGKLRSIQGNDGRTQPQSPSQPQPFLPMPQKEATPIGTLNAPLVNKAPEIQEVRSMSVCAGKAGSIVCPDLRIIRIHGAFFGKQTGRDCLGRLTRDNIPTCFAPYAISTVRDICQGQQSCDLYTEERMYGRSSCPATDKKYLSVTYSCIGHSNLERNLQLIKQRGRQGWPAANAARLAPSAYNPSYNAKLPWYQQAAARSIAARPVPRYPFYPKANPSVYQRPAARQMPFYPKANPSVYQRPAARQMPFYPKANPSVYQRPAARQMLETQYQPAQYNPAMNQQLNSFNAFTTSPSCDMCNGDCNNWACFGCGGCDTPQAVQQTYTYPYQRQDAAFHDSFMGHEMALSGMVLWPVPKLPKAMRKLNPPKTRSETYEEEADDGSATGEGSGDDEDDEDDTR